MQGSAHRYFHRLQICLAGLLALGENTREQGGYFARALALDGFGRFFFLESPSVVICLNRSDFFACD